MRLRLLACALVAVLAAALLGTPAHAARKPAQVGLVSFTAAALHTSGGKTYAKLRLSWPKAKYATRYQVFVATTKAGVQRAKKPRVTVRGTQAVVTKLGRNRTYWFQVRGTNGKVAGSRSARVARVTPLSTASLSTATHPIHSMMSYNVCSNACTSRAWSGRQPLVVNQILAVRPGVVAIQEASRWSTTVPGYTEVEGGKDNRILYRDDLYEPVTQDLTPAQQSSKCPLQRTAKGALVRDEDGEPVRVEPCTLPVLGVAQPQGKDAPWVMLRHKASGQQVVFVGVHLLTGDSDANARYRAVQTDEIFADLKAHLAWWGRSFPSTPVALIGDFNTNRSRSNHAIVESAFKRQGFYDSYEQARSLSRQHQNTANPNWQWKTPTIGVTWGDHVDKVWVRPARSIVKSWANVGLMRGGSYVSPLPSDHHPLLVRAQLS
ncbi:endonuclease/exonuclease/phosphatase family protein [Aeromicrobium sp. 179-A 4D2 NHS]|uniref:endonuclease/exonuclease/phosphatase family protein n=1 Tax=Aeromicrobium sp. 179-A 4D2 NHS TaxID=3142375 RepID=UPI0039A11EB6